MLGPIPNGKELHYADNKIGNLKKYPHHSPRNIFFIRRSATMWLRYNPTVATLTNGQISLPRDSLTTGLYNKAQAENPQTQKFVLLSFFCTSIYSEIDRASCRERGCQYVEISVVAVSLKKK